MENPSLLACHRFYIKRTVTLKGDLFAFFQKLDKNIDITVCKINFKML